MIARMWRGWTAAGDAEAYVQYMTETGLPDSLGTEGNRGMLLLHRRDGEREEFVTLSLWESEDAIRAFAGDEIDRAVFYPEDAGYLVERELHVTHWNVGRAEIP